MTTVIESILGSIDFLYIILCNVITWFLLECLSLTKLKESLSTWVKRVLATCVAISLGAIMYYGFHRPFEAMFYGFFIQYLSWDYFFKAIIERIRNTINGPFKKHNEI